MAAGVSRHCVSYGFMEEKNLAVQLNEAVFCKNLHRVEELCLEIKNYKKTDEISRYYLRQALIFSVMQCDEADFVRIILNELSFLIDVEYIATALERAIFSKHLNCFKTLVSSEKFILIPIDEILYATRIIFQNSVEYLDYLTFLFSSSRRGYLGQIPMIFLNNFCDGNLLKVPMALRRFYSMSF